MAKVKIAIGLLIASLVLLIIYGADAAVAGQSAPPPDGSTPKGFLPVNEAVRGGAFGGGAVVMSIIAFVIARKERSSAISILLFINGGLIIAGMIALIGQGALNSGRPGAASTVGSTIGLGAVLIGLGVWKTILDKRVPAKEKESSSR